MSGHAAAGRGAPGSHSLLRRLRLNGVVLVVAWNGELLLPACLDSLLAGSPAPSVLVVDNASADATLRLARDRVERFREAGGELRILPLPRNLGFTAGANAGMRHLVEPAASERRPPADAVVLLNQDTEVDPGWLDALLDVLERRPEAGAVGSRIRFPGGNILQHAGGRIERPRFVGVHDGEHLPDDGAPWPSERDVEFATGAALALRADALREVGFFDEIFSPGYYEDAELCARLAAAGWKTLVSGEARLVHRESASFEDLAERLALSHRNRLVFALPHFADPAIFEAFLAAEEEHLRTTAPAVEARAIAAAILDFLLLLDRAAKSRAGALPPGAFLHVPLPLSKLRGTALAAARRAR